MAGSTKLGRTSLKEYFKNGSKPDEVAFDALIDSTINIVSDGYPSDVKDLEKISPKTSSNTYLSFYQDDQPDTKASWIVDNHSTSGKTGLAFNIPEGTETIFFLDDGGKVGVNNSDPKAHLDIGGTLSTSSIFGNYSLGVQPGEKLLSDGNWHTLLTDIDSATVFDVVAKVEDSSDSNDIRYALLEATVMCLPKLKMNIFKRIYAFLHPSYIVTESIRKRLLMSSHQASINLKWESSSTGRNLKIKASGFKSKKAEIVVSVIERKSSVPS